MEYVKNSVPTVGVIIITIILTIIATCMLILASDRGGKAAASTEPQRTYAYVELPDGTCVEGNVDQWTTLGRGDLLQVVIEGKTYRTGCNRIVMVDE